MRTQFPDQQFDGLYNLGVMEHFLETEFPAVFGEFHRILKPNGRLVLFWPPEFGLSVVFLKGVHYILNDILGRNQYLHPPEPSRVRSRKGIDEKLRMYGFELEDFSFGIHDLFTHAIVIARKT